MSTELKFHPLCGWLVITTSQKVGEYFSVKRAKDFDVGSLQKYFE